MSRKEFSKVVKRQAWDRAQGQCEAVGEWYGLEPGRRCGASIAKVVQYDHIILDANSHDNSLENCAAVCQPCHLFKTRHRDTPLAAKTLRQQDKDRGIKGRGGFCKPPEGWKYSWKSGRMERV